MRAGLVPRLHANQLAAGPGVRIAVEFGAASADHCTHLAPSDVDALAGSQTVATDRNPGSSYTTSMPFCTALAVREMRMTAGEAVWAATAGGARAPRRTDIGRLGPGACADFTVLAAPSYRHLAYRPGVPLVAQVWRPATRPPPAGPLGRWPPRDSTELPVVDLG